MQRGGKPQVVFHRRGILLEPVGCGPQVPDIRPEPLLPPPGVHGEEWVRGLGTGEEKLRVTAPQLGRLTRLLQPLVRELPHRLEHPIPRLDRLCLERDERFIRETAEQVQHLCRGGRAECSHRLCRIEREPAGEHRQPAEQDPLGLGEQRVAPLDRAAQRALPRCGRAAPRREQPEHVVEPGGDLLGIEHPRPRGGQLDGQGEPVEPPADVRDRRDVVVPQLE